MSSFYLAARFSRMEEMQGYARLLEAHGHEVTSRWIRGKHNWDGPKDVDLPPEIAARFALEDIEDIYNAGAMILFTDDPNAIHARPSQGGKDFEAGYAFGTGKPLLIIGPAQNVFYAIKRNEYSEWVRRFNDWNAFREYWLDLTGEELAHLPKTDGAG